MDRIKTATTTAACDVSRRVGGPQNVSRDINDANELMNCCNLWFIGLILFVYAVMTTPAPSMTSTPPHSPMAILAACREASESHPQARGRSHLERPIAAG